jgi:hypothetical protein
MKLGKVIRNILIPVALVFLVRSPLLVKADDISTSVTVGNDPPAFTTDTTCTGSYPCESPARYAASPVNVGSSTTFRATATEPNGEDYYLIVCKTDVFNENNSGAPTCDSGQTICVSTATTTDTAATCNYDALQADSEQQAWYAEVCDDNTTDQTCSASTQGNTGGAPNEASPLEVNHAPDVTVVNNDAGSGSPNYPGTNVTWTTTASDPDTTRVDTIDLYVCDSNSFNGTACAGNLLCSDTGVASDPTCQYAIPAGTDDDSSPYSAYAFIVDNFDFDPSVSTQSDYYVANVAPTILSISTNSGSDISLTGGEYPSTTNISFAVDVQDNNGCSDLASPGSYVIYLSSVSGGNACTGNVNDCYTGDTGAYAVSCSAGATCTGGTDVDATYTCTAAMQYHTDPTVANTPWASDNWLSYFSIDDDDAANAYNTASGVELNMLQALNAGNLSYGNMTAGSTDSTLTDSNTVDNTGNTALDTQVSSSAAMDDGNGHTIAVNNQRADETSGTAWASAAVTLSGSGQTIETNITKTTISASPENGAVYWGINIPSGQFPGLYTGTTTEAAYYSAVGEGW